MALDGLVDGDYPPRMPSPNDNHVRAALGRRIRQLRKAKGLTQTELGDRSGGIKTGEISRFETAQRTPSIETLARLATGLNVSLPELLDFEDPGQPLPEAEHLGDPAHLHPEALHLEHVGDDDEDDEVTSDQE